MISVPAFVISRATCVMKDSIAIRIKEGDIMILLSIHYKYVDSGESELQWEMLHATHGLVYDYLKTCIAREQSIDLYIAPRFEVIK